MPISSRTSQEEFLRSGLLLDVHVQPFIDPLGGFVERRLTAMVDTGAHHSVVRLSKVAVLGLEERGGQEIAHVDGRTVLPVLPARIRFDHGALIEVELLGASLDHQDTFDLLIGRDVLQHLHCRIDGTLGLVELTFP